MNVQHAPKMVEKFSVVPALSWDNPKDVPILEHISRTRGEQYALLATLPDDEYRHEIGLLMELNQNLPSDRE